MSEWIRIRVKDFYKDAVGEREYTYVTREVYEALADTFRKEAHTGNAGYQTYDQGRIYRRRNGRSGGADRGIGRGYGHPADGNRNPAESNAVTHPSAESGCIFFFEGMTYRQIAAKEGVGEKNIRESINGAVKKIKKYFD